MFQRLSSRPKTYITIIVILLSITSMDYFPVSIMEARNFVTAREMIQDNNWLLTTMNGEARYEKPPFPTYLSAISASVFGLNSVLAMRLPAIVMLIFTGIFGYLLSLKLLKHRAKSFINALLLITSFYVLGIAIEAPWDIFAHGLMLMGIYFIVSILKSTITKISHIMLAALCVGLSFLSKGPVALYALLLPFFISYLIIYRSAFTSKNIAELVVVLLLALIIGGWWYMYVRISDPVVFEQITSKETSNWRSYNVRPIYYYWSFFVQSGIWTIPAFVALLYPYLKNRVENLSAYKFTLLWTLIAVVLLSIIPEKKSRYLMPVLIPLALNTGFYLDYLRRRFKFISSKLELTPIYLNFLILTIICLLIPISLYFAKDYFVGLSVIWFSLLSIGLLFCAVAILFGLKNRNAKTLILATVGIMVNILLFMPPIYDRMKKYNFHSIASLQKNKNLNANKLYSWHGVAPEMIWEYGDKIPSIINNDNALVLPKESQFNLLVDPKNEEFKSWLIDNNLKLEKITTYNLNRSAEDSGNYRDRLVNDLYTISLP